MAGRRDAGLEAAGRRHLRSFGLALLLAAVLVALLNQLSFRALSRPRFRSLAQMTSGWDRTTKPLFYEQVRPQVVALGASWVRDAFDPEPIEALLGQRFFNFGVSGGRPYEAKRFLESALAVSPPEHVVLNLNSFEDRSEAFRSQPGFDERLLRVKADGTPNRWVAVHRFVALNLSGAALGYNLSVLGALARQALGARREDVLESYDRFDYRPWGPALAALRAQILRGEPAPGGAERPRLVPEEAGRLDTLQEILALLCERGVAAHTYYTAHHVLSRSCRAGSEREAAVLRMLRQRRAACSAPLSYHVFEYPNAVTLEGVLSEVSLSRLYRSDRHPRPPLGTLMMARMLDRPLPFDGLTAPLDFGADLLAMSPDEALAWLGARKARCQGRWGAGELESARISADQLALALEPTRAPEPARRP